MTGADIKNEMLEDVGTGALWSHTNSMLAKLRFMSDNEEISFLMKQTQL